jgi:lipopolysaccharide export system permease protein
MNTLTRYIVLELLKIFSVTLTCLTLLMILVGVGQEAVRMGLGPGPIVRLVPFFLPNALAFAVPGTILFTVCSVYGRMSAANEVVAIKSLGISPMALVWPALGLAFVLSLVAVWLNDLEASWGYSGVQRVVVESVEGIAYGMLRTQRSYNGRQFSINVKRVDGRRLIRPTISFQANGDTPAVMVTAQEAELRADPADNTLRILLTNGRIDVGDRITMVFPDTIERVVSLNDASTKAGGLVAPWHLPLARIRGEVIKQQERIGELEELLAADAAYQMMTGDFAGLTDAAWSQRQNNLTETRYQLRRLRVEPWKRWASGFSCFFFVLIGAPLAIRLRNADLMTSFLLCFLPILIVYYPFLAFGVDRAKNGALPPYGVWLANLVCLGIGLWMLRKVIRH